MDINLKGLFFSPQAVEPIMHPGGSIILNASWLNQTGAPGRALLSAELLERRIRVNAVSPGAIVVDSGRAGL